MSEHSYTRLWTHFIFHTKNLQPFINAAAEPAVHEHIKAQFAECGCPVHIVNGTPDHVHALVMQNPMMTATDVAKQVKGNTSYWINYNSIIQTKFSWEKGFSAFSVSDRDLLDVFDKIQLQKAIHETISFTEEMDALIAANGMLPRHTAK